jgi:MerR family transcriptional regulator, light-induced transcriptional regulator
MTEEYRYPLRAVALQTGLSGHVIRVWERRYGAVKPERTDGGRRCYREEDIARLKKLARLTGAGHRISELAVMGEGELEGLLSEVGTSGGSEVGMGVEASECCAVDDAMAAVQELDSARLEAVLERSLGERGHLATLRDVIAPLAGVIGEGWRRGSLRVAHEHFASAVIRDFLGSTARGYGIGEEAPELVVATPTGQLHELGALLVGALARDSGWRVVHLGTCVPAEEIAAAAKLRGARALALSLVFPEDDAALGSELRRLARLVPDGCAILAGGRAAAAYAEVLSEIGAHLPGDLDGLMEVLDGLRCGAKVA